MALDPSNVVLRINKTERIGLVSRHNNLVLSLRIGDEIIDCLRPGRVWVLEQVRKEKQLSSLYQIHLTSK
jgi:hypothetical protein